jgi:hypothetical protein
MKKILALVLVLSLVLGTFSFAFADGHLPEDVVGEDSETAVATLMALGVVNGYPDGTYKPERTVTRAEMAKLLVEAQGYGQLAAGATSTFPDVQGTWAESYVGFAASMGIVQGYPDGTFRPSQPMTVDEAMTMVIRALGYTDESLKGSWPTNYKVKALDLELTDGMSALSGPGLRGDVAILLYNALEAKLVEVDADNAITFDMDGDDFRLFIDRIGEKVDMSDEEDAADQIVQPENVIGEDAWDTTENINLEDYLFHTLTYYLNADDEVAYVSEVQTNELAGTVVDKTADTITLDDDDDTVFNVTTNTALFLNGDEAVDSDVLDLDENEAEVTVVYDDDDVVLGVVAWDYDFFPATGTYSERTPTQLTRSSGSRLLPSVLDADDEEVLDEENLTIEGDVEALEDIEKDDLVYYYATETEGDEGNPAKVKLIVIRETFDGKYTRKVDTNEWTIGGETFEISVNAKEPFTDSLVLGEEYTLTLDKDGKVYDAEKYSAGTVEEDYALFIAPSNGVVDEEADVYVVDTMPKVRLFTEGGDAVLYEIEVDDLADETDDWTTDAAIQLSDTDGLFELSYTVGGDIVIDTTLIKEDLVEYTLNDDGQVDSIELVDETYADIDYDEDDMVVNNSYDVLDTTVIFSTQDGDWNDWTVEEVSFLTDGTDSMSAKFVVDADDYFVKVMVVESGGDVEDPDTTYAVITDAVDVYDEDQDAAVLELTALVDGEEVTYLTEEDAISSVDTDLVVILTLDDGLVDKIEYPDSEEDFEVSEVKGMQLREEGTGLLYTIADDAAVFLIDDDGAEAVDFNDIIVGDNVELYDYDEDDDVYGVVVIDLTTPK